MNIFQQNNHYCDKDFWLSTCSIEYIAEGMILIKIVGKIIKKETLFPYKKWNYCLISFNALEETLLIFTLCLNFDMGQTIYHTCLLL